MRHKRCVWPPPHCEAANRLGGAYFRRMCSRMDKPKAVTAAAHKLARLIYTMLTKGEEYTDQGQTYYEERYRERVLRQRSHRASKLGMKLVAEPQPT